MIKKKLTTVQLIALAAILYAGFTVIPLLFISPLGRGGIVGFIAVAGMILIAVSLVILIPIIKAIDKQAVKKDAQLTPSGRSQQLQRDKLILNIFFGLIISYFVILFVQSSFR